MRHPWGGRGGKRFLASVPFAEKRGGGPKMWLGEQRCFEEAFKHTERRGIKESGGKQKTQRRKNLSKTHWMGHHEFWEGKRKRSGDRIKKKSQEPISPPRNIIGVERQDECPHREIGGNNLYQFGLRSCEEERRGEKPLINRKKRDTSCKPQRGGLYKVCKE